MPTPATLNDPDCRPDGDAAGLHSVQELSKYMAGMNDDDDEAARSLLSPFERDGLLIYSGDPRKTGSIDFVNPATPWAART